jgi:hypothetical protein
MNSERLVARRAGFYNCTGHDFRRSPPTWANGKHWPAFKLMTLHGQLLSEYPEIEWKKVKGLRDIISHQYFDINVEAIFDVCQKKLPELRLVIDKMLIVLLIRIN